MKNLLIPALLVSSAGGCFIDGYCSDTVAGAPSCDPGGGGGGGDPDAASAALAPFELGDRSVTDRIATGGSAELGITTQHVNSPAVRRGNEAVERLPSGRWRVTDVVDDDAVLVTGTHSTTGQPFAQTLLLRVAPVDRIVLAPSAAYARLADGAAVFLARPGDEAPTTFVQLRSAAGARLVDVSMAVDGGQAFTAIVQDGWDHLVLPTSPGSYRIGLSADSFGKRDTEVTVVDHLDRLEARRPKPGTVCFHAVTDDREVFADWTFTVDGVPQRPSGSNCMDSTGTIVASAGGLVLSADDATP